MSNRKCIWKRWQGIKFADFADSSIILWVDIYTLAQQMAMFREATSPSLSEAVQRANKDGLGTCS